MPELLPSAPVRDLRHAPHGGWSRRAAGGLVLVGGSVLLVAVMVSAPYPPCTETDPCGPDRAGNLLIGLLVSTLFAGWLGLRFAASLGVVIGAGLAWYTLTWPDEGPHGWTVALALGYALGCLLLDRRVGRRRPAPEPGRMERQPPPALPWSVRPPARPTLAAVALVGAAVAVAVWCDRAQDRADARQAAATVVVGTVRSHPEWDVLEVGLADGNSARVHVFDAAEHPVGGNLRLAVDDRGLRQPLAERYDLSQWHALVSILAVAGLGLSGPLLVLVRSRWRFARRPQPVSEVFAEPTEGAVRLHLRASGGKSIGEIPTGAAEALPAGARTRVMLHGTPLYGQWCVVTTGAVPLPPRGPLRPAPDRRPPAVKRSTARWPELRPAETVGTVLLVLAAIVAGIQAGEPVLTGLLDLLCTADRCSPLGLAAAGWAVVGAPLLLAGVLYRHSRPGRVALYAMVGCVVPLSFGLAVLLGDFDTARELRPDVGMLGIGVGAGLLPLLAGGVARSPAAGPDRPRAGRRAEDGADPGRPLMVVNIGQVATLVAVLTWAAVAG